MIRGLKSLFELCKRAPIFKRVSKTLAKLLSYINKVLTRPDYKLYWLNWCWLCNSKRWNFHPQDSQSNEDCLDMSIQCWNRIIKQGLLSFMRRRKLYVDQRRVIIIQSSLTCANPSCSKNILHLKVVKGDPKTMNLLFVNVRSQSLIHTALKPFVSNLIYWP